MTARFAHVNGIRMAYRIQGEGPPLVLVMGYRLSSVAWPSAFIEALALRFTIITPDNRGTGLSDKPVDGYALANMARDIAELLDKLGIQHINLLGYSMGGGIAQEFIRQFPERVQSLMLCATMCGGERATYAEASVTRVMRDIDGLTPEQIARRIWRVTYAPAYLKQHENLAEAQTRREIASPTPLHSADLQFQAFAEFDGSKALAAIRCPTLVLTGDLDELIPPQNSVVMAKCIPDAKLVIIPGGGHRVLWEAPEECIDLVLDFLGAPSNEPITARRPNAAEVQMPGAANTLASTFGLLSSLPLTIARGGFGALAALRTSIMTGSAARYGDGKPVVLMPRFPASDLALAPLAAWLKALGYRPVTAGGFAGIGLSSGDHSVSEAVGDITRRIGRKAVLVAHSSSMTNALRAARADCDAISDVIIFDASHRPQTDGLRVHFVSSGWTLFQGMNDLHQLLRSIGIELIETATPDRRLLERPSIG